MKSPKGNEPSRERPPLDASIGQKAVEVGLITAAQLREVLLELSRSPSVSADVATVLISRGLLSAAQVEILSGAPLKQLGKYTIVRELGRGGMGVVYEAEDSDLGRRVALKMLLGSLHSDPQESALEEERFIREARLSANLPKHPQIIGVYEAGLLEGRRFIAMEYVEGRQFSDWRRQGSISLRQQITVLRDTAMAIDHAHRHGIIHRDLKPANILVDRKNHPHVADFGLAKRTTQSAALSLTASGMVMGTPAYMSPEQAHGGKEVDHRSDLWAMGVMLYEILTGRLPFDADSPVKILVKTLNDPVPPPSRVVRTPTAVLDAAIEAICMKALAKDPALRYGSARAFAEDLGRWLKGDRVSVLTKSRAPNKAAWIGGAAGAVLVAGLAAWIALSPSSEEQAAERARAFVSQGRRLMQEGHYSDAIVKFGQARAEDPSNREASLGRKEAEERLIAASKPDSARIHEAVQKDLAGVDATLATLRGSEKFGAARDLLLQAARRRSEEEWTTAIAIRLEGLRKTVDETYIEVKTKATAAKMAGEAASAESAVHRVKGWTWPGLSEELDLELARVRVKPAAVPPAAVPPATVPPAVVPPAPALPVANRPITGIRALEPIRGSLNAISSMAFSGDGKLLVTTDFDNTVRLWDVAARAERARIPDKFSGRCCAFSPDGRWIVGGSMGGELRIWDVAGLKGRTLTAGEFQFMGVAFTRDSRTVLCSSVEGIVRVWDVETGLCGREMKWHPRGALGLSISPDDRFVAVGCGEPILKIWEIATGREVRQFEVGKSSIFYVAYSPDGKSVAFGGDDGTLFIGDQVGGNPRPLGSYSKPIRGVAWSPDGRWIATTSVDPALRLWDSSTGSFTGIDLEGGFFAVAISPKGDFLAAGGSDWSLRFWEIPPAGKK
ncbi:MAG TPA: protein kinase [Planctomycetota bacterium]|nr:protein kinase [Planctomycetota bacterium]